MKDILRQVTYKGLKEGQTAYFIRLSEMGRPTFEILVTQSDPTIKSVIKNVEHIKYIKNN